MQLIAKLLLTIVLTIVFFYGYFISLHTVWTKELDLKYPLKAVKAFIESHIPTTISGISVSVSQISLSAKEWLGVSTFSINNTTDKTLYNICTKLEIEESGINPQDLEILPENESDFMTVTTKDFKTSFDIVQVKGTDSKGRGCIFVFLYKLSPKSSQAFKIRLIKEPGGTIASAKVFVKLIEVSEEPAKIVYDDKRAAIKVHIPENIQVKAMTFLLRKNQ